MSGCPACGGPLVRWIEVPAFEPEDERRFPLLRCERCRSAVTGGEPPGPSAYSAGLYEDARPPTVVTRVRRLALRQPAAWLRCGGLQPGGRLLDVGAGRGLLVEELRRAGYDARGIDPAGRATAGFAVERRALGDHTDADLDAVVMWHVLEHLDDPGGALRRVHGWLRPGGLLLVGVPNLDSWQRVVAGERWLHYDVPRHRTHLTPAGLRALLRGAGFEPGRVRHFVWEQNAIGMALAPVRRPARALRAVKGGRVGAAWLGFAVALAVPAEALAAAARRGGTIACVAVKR